MAFAKLWKRGYVEPDLKELQKLRSFAQTEVYRTSFRR